MGWNRHTPEQISRKLREAVLELLSGIEMQPLDGDRGAVVLVGAPEHGAEAPRTSQGGALV